MPIAYEVPIVFAAPNAGTAIPGCRSSRLAAAQVWPALRATAESLAERLPSSLFGPDSFFRAPWFGGLCGEQLVANFADGSAASGTPRDIVGHGESCRHG